MPTNKEIVKAAYASFAVGDVPSVLAVMDPRSSGQRQRGGRYTTAPSSAPKPSSTESL